VVEILTLIAVAALFTAAAASAAFLPA